MNNDFSARAEKLRQQQERARERKLAKIRSPEYQEKARATAKARNDKAIERQRAKQADPEYRAKQYKKARQTTSKDRRILNKKPVDDAKPVKKPVKKVTYRERAKTSHEKKLWDELGQLPCMACLVHGKEKHPVSIHHMTGRTTENCHKFVIPLCEWHHDTPAPEDARSSYQWLVPRHAKGSLGGKAAFEKANATERELMLNAYTMIGRREEALILLAL